MDPNAGTSDSESDKNGTKPKLPGSGEKTPNTPSQASSAPDLSKLAFSTRSAPTVPDAPPITSTAPSPSFDTITKNSTLMEPVVNHVVITLRKLLDVFDVNCWFKLSGKSDWVRWDAQLNRGLYCIDQRLPLILNKELVKPIDREDDDSGMFGMTTAQKELAVCMSYGSTSPLAFLSYNAHIERHIREWEDLDRIGDMLIKRALAPNALAWLGQEIRGFFAIYLTLKEKYGQTKWMKKQTMWQMWNDLRPGQIESAPSFISRFRRFQRAYEIEAPGADVQPMILFHIFTKAIMVRADFAPFVERLEFEGEEPVMDKIYSEFAHLECNGTYRRS
ncbi:hypothetical protein N7454_006338 [Penicillium verhagenii]|nr:hypothetical protein N7454_006338 [Penicillium verhagenii]